MSLDDKRTELLPPEKLGPVPKAALTADDHAKNNLPDLLRRWRTFGVSSFGVPPLGGKASELSPASKSSKPASPSHASPPNRSQFPLTFPADLTVIQKRRITYPELKNN